MKKHTKLYIPIFVMSILIFNACVSYKFEDQLSKSKSLDVKLPYLDLRIDTQSFLEVYHQYKYDDAFYHYNPNLRRNKDTWVYKNKAFTGSSFSYGSTVSYYTSSAYKISPDSKWLIVNYLDTQSPYFKGDARGVTSHLNNNSGGFLEYSDTVFDSYGQFLEAFPDFENHNVKFSSLNVDENKAKEIDQSLITRVKDQYVFKPSEATTSQFFSEDITVTVTPVQIFLDAKTNENLVQIAHDHQYNICSEKQGESKGYIKISVVESKFKDPSLAWFIGSTFTVYTINLVGFPIAQKSLKLEMKAEIYNSDNELVYSTTVKEKAKKFSAMYWGYSMVSALVNRVNPKVLLATNSKAVIDCMNAIKKDINSNYPEIISKL